MKREKKGTSPNLMGESRGLAPRNINRNPPLKDQRVLKSKIDVEYYYNLISGAIPLAHCDSASGTETLRRTSEKNSDANSTRTARNDTLGTTMKDVGGIPVCTLPLLPALIDLTGRKSNG